MRAFGLILLMATMNVQAGAAGLHARSALNGARLIELFSSEGCSSCPPADAWLSSLRTRPGLWRSFVPIVFHVTYWDYLGWPDPLGDKVYTARQRAYSAAWGSSSVYTPGFVLDGAEWRGWGRALPEAGGAAGILDAREDKGTLQVRFSPAKAAGPYEVHAARLGFRIESQVVDGENAGRTLRHDFVALSLVHAPLKRVKAVWSAAPLFPPAQFRAPREGLAVWVTDGRGRVVQAAGAGLP